MLKELSKIFGSVERVKLLRFFLANPEQQITLTDLEKKSKIKNLELKKELKNLLNIGFINELTIFSDLEIVEKNKFKKDVVEKVKIKSIKEDGYELNKEYVFVNSLANLLLDFEHIDQKELLEDLKKFGKIKLLCLGGVFKKDEDSKLDILVSGDALDKEKIDEYIKKLEADFGTELKYAVFESEEFRYRVNMFDRLLTDFWKRPHDKVLEKISTRP